MAAGDEGLMLALIARIPRDGVEEFQAYEACVLPLFGAHGGRLERRLRSADGMLEVHVVRFESAQMLQRYRADPRRAASQPLLAGSGAITETSEVLDVI